MDESLVGYGDFSEASGRRAMRTLLDRHPDLDAVFAASDLMAVGAMRVLREYGRRVPDDVAVVGFEDSVLARQTEPPLTTVHQPVEAMGREMAAAAGRPHPRRPAGGRGGRCSTPTWSSAPPPDRLTPPSAWPAGRRASGDPARAR